MQTNFEKYPSPAYGDVQKEETEWLLKEKSLNQEKWKRRFPLGMNVFSAFDGISATQVALERLGIPVNNYYSSEIDKPAIAITQKNYPYTIQLGDIKKIAISYQRIYIDGISEPHRWDEAKPWLEKYDHPLWKKYGEYAQGSGHGGMDFFVLNAFVESAKQNIAPPLDAYDAAAWSAITPLSELSIENNGEPQNFPDFTRGLWVTRKPYDWIKDSH